METPVSSSVKSPVKVSKGKFDRKFRPYISEKDTQPINDVYREGKLVEGLTDEQKVNEGLVPPLAWQGQKNENGDVIGRFQKTAKEREDLAAAHSCSKGPRGGSRKKSRQGEIRSTLIIQRVNIHHKKDFKTTLSLQAYPNEVALLVDIYHDPKKHKLVNKVYYRGESLQID